MEEKQIETTTFGKWTANTVVSDSAQISTYVSAQVDVAIEKANELSNVLAQKFETAELSAGNLSVDVLSSIYIGSRDAKEVIDEEAFNVAATTIRSWDEEA